MRNEDDMLLSLQQAAALTDYRPQTLRIAARAGRLRAKKFGRDWVTTAEDVRRWLDDPKAHRPGPKRKD